MKWIVCAFALLLTPSMAFAQAVGTPSPYTFTVPVQLENLPETTSVLVRCSVSRLGPGATGAFAVGNEVANGETRVAVTGGRYNGDVRVPTNWRMAGATGASYQCTYTLAGPNATGGEFSATSRDMYTRLTGRRITSGVSWTEGTIP